MEVDIYAKQIKKQEQVIHAKYLLQNKNSNIVGQIDVRYNCLYQNNVEMKYQIFKSFRGNKMASKAVELVLKDIFVNKTLDGIPYKNLKGETEKTICKSIQIQIEPSNIASIKVAKKNGFALYKNENGFSGKITPELFRKHTLENDVLER